MPDQFVAAVPPLLVPADARQACTSSAAAHETLSAAREFCLRALCTVGLCVGLNAGARSIWAAHPASPPTPAQLRALLRRLRALPPA